MASIMVTVVNLTASETVKRFIVQKAIGTDICLVIMNVDSPDFVTQLGAVLRSP